MLLKSMLKVVLAVSLMLTAGCISVFTDQVQIAGDQRLVVGHKESFWGPAAKIWILEGNTFKEVNVRIEGGHQ